MIFTIHVRERFILRYNFCIIYSVSAQLAPQQTRLNWVIKGFSCETIALFTKPWCVLYVEYIVYIVVVLLNIHIYFLGTFNFRYQHIS